MAGKKGQKNRVWSDEEKLSICRQARVPQVSVAQLYAMSTNLIGMETALVGRIGGHWPIWAIIASKTLLCGAQAPCPVFRHHKPRSKSKRLLKVSEPFWPCPSLLGWFSCKLVLLDIQNRTQPPIISWKNYGKTISEQGG